MKAVTTSSYAALVGTMALALTTACFFAPSIAVAAPDDEAAIRALEDRLAAAVSTGDVNAIMKSYVPDQSLVVFDVVPPRQYLGADAYRKDWVDFLAIFKSPPKFDITDLAIATEGNLGFSHSIQRVRGTDTKGQPLDLTVRVTGGSGQQRVGGRREGSVRLVRTGLDRARVASVVSDPR